MPKHSASLLLSVLVLASLVMLLSFLPASARAIILSFNSTFRAPPATADSSIGAPVTIILSGTVQDGNVTGGVIKVTSGFVVIGGLVLVVCSCIPPGYNGSDLDCIYTSASEEGLISASTISLGGVLVMHLAGLYALVNDTLLSVVFGVETPFPGSTAITEGCYGPIDYLINAQGSIQVNGTSIYLAANGTVTSGPSMSLNVCPCKTVVCEGYSLPINVTITNVSYLSLIPYVTVCLNTTVIGTETNINLSNRTQTTINLKCNTSSFGLGKYNVTAYPGNVSSPDFIVLTIPGDVDGNFQVQLADLVILAKTYGSKPADTNWNPNADIDNNCAVGLTDLVVLANHYGEHHP
jgi:hypothetical protein